MHLGLFCVICRFPSDSNVEYIIQMVTSVEGGDAAAAALTAVLGASGVEGGDATPGLAIAASDGDASGAVALNEINDGTVLYIDPNDPQAAALLQQAGLMLSEDGTVQTIGATEAPNLDANVSSGVPHLLSNAAGGELVEASTNGEGNAAKQEMVNLPSAPDPTVKPKDIIEESLVRIFGLKQN